MPIPPRLTAAEHAARQAAFLGAQLEPRLAEARAGRRAVFLCPSWTRPLRRGLFPGVGVERGPGVRQGRVGASAVQRAGGLGAWGPGLALTLGIELLSLPSYSPNLNLIERLRKCLRRQAPNSPRHASFAAFRAAIDGASTGCQPPTNSRSTAP